MQAASAGLSPTSAPRRRDVFSEITLASRTKSKCDAIAAQIDYLVKTARVDADNVPELVDLINREKPNLVLNVALPYQDLTIMDACLETGVDYLDTANYEPRDTAHFEYHWQWAYQERFREKGLMALLGSGFDPGVTNVYTALAAKKYLDVVAGDRHHRRQCREPRPAVRHQLQPGDQHPRGDRALPSLGERAVGGKRGALHKAPFDFPEGIGPMNIYRMFHEEMESLVKHIPTIKKAQFWMTFSDNYLKHLEVLQNVGMTRIDEVEFNGQKIVPLQFLKAVLPDPGSLGPLTKGKTCIGVIARGLKDGKRRQVYIYNICDHEACYREVKSQAISYTTGVPAAVGAIMMLTGKWHKPGVWNMEQFDPGAVPGEIGGDGAADGGGGRRRVAGTVEKLVSRAGKAYSFAALTGRGRE